MNWYETIRAVKTPKADPKHPVVINAKIPVQPDNEETFKLDGNGNPPSCYYGLMAPAANPPPNTGSYRMVFADEPTASTLINGNVKVPPGYSDNILQTQQTWVTQTVTVTAPDGTVYTKTIEFTFGINADGTPIPLKVTSDIEKIKRP